MQVLIANHVIVEILHLKDTISQQYSWSLLSYSLYVPFVKFFESLYLALCCMFSHCGGEPHSHLIYSFWLVVDLSIILFLMP